MKQPDKDSPLEEDFALRIRSRISTPINLKMPSDVVASLEKIAASKDMSVEALLKLYVGQGLRQDLSRQFADRVLDKTAQVLSRHLQSEEEVTAILKEIRVETAQ